MRFSENLSVTLNSTGLLVILSASGYINSAYAIKRNALTQRMCPTVELNGHANIKQRN